MSQQPNNYRGPPLSKKLARDPKRKQRLLNGKKLVLYHQTSPTIAQKILSSGEFLRGQGGIVGGGIYFAETAQATNLKAQQQGQILKAEILVGNVKVQQYSNLKQYRFTELAKEGYDTVKVTGRSTGVEYIIYNYDQVKRIGKHGNLGWETDGKYYRKISSYQNNNYNNNKSKYGNNNNSNSGTSTVTSVMSLLFFGTNSSNSNSKSNYKVSQFLDKQTRAKRLRREKLVECFYLAHHKEASKIINEKKIYRSKGKCGEGIYFDENKPRKYDKRKYVLLRCLVQIGLNKKLKKPDKNLSYKNLASNGYDSIYYDDQYIIYNYDQIYKVDKYDKNYDRRKKSKRRHKKSYSSSDSESSDSSDNSNRRHRSRSNRKRHKHKSKHRHKKRRSKTDKEIEDLKDQISQLTTLVTQLAKNQSNNGSNNNKNNNNNNNNNNNQSSGESDQASESEEQFDQMYQEDDDGVSD